MISAALLATMALGSASALATSPVPEQRAKLKAEWAEAQARNAANSDATFVERLFGLGIKDTKVTSKPASAEQRKN